MLYIKVELKTKNIKILFVNTFVKNTQDTWNCLSSNQQLHERVQGRRTYMRHEYAGFLGAERHARVVCASNNAEAKRTTLLYQCHVLEQPSHSKLVICFSNEADFTPFPPINLWTCVKVCESWYSWLINLKGLLKTAPFFVDPSWWINQHMCICYLMYWL